jgi:hypothetical protein
MNAIKASAVVLLALCAGTVGPSAFAAASPLYATNFAQVDVGSVPADFLILDGAFAVQQEGAGKFLELPGEPLDTFGLLFGPSVSTNVAVSARIFGTSHGRRQPTFGVGLGGQSGYRLQVAPGKGTLDIYRKDLVVASVPYQWKSGQWTVLRLRVVASPAGYRIEGNVWTDGTPEPDQPLITFDEKDDLRTGRPSLWGSPFAGTPIRYDDLRLSRVESTP